MGRNASVHAGRFLLDLILLRAEQYRVHGVAPVSVHRLVLSGHPRSQSWWNLHLIWWNLLLLLLLVLLVVLAVYHLLVSLLLETAKVKILLDVLLELEDARWLCRLLLLRECLHFFFYF